MKNTYNIKYMLRMLVFSLLAIQFTSCSDFLEEAPVTESSDQTFWVNGEAANSAIAASYSELRKALNNGLSYFVHGDLPTDEFSKTSIYKLNWDYQALQEVTWGLAASATQSDRPMYRARDFSAFYATIKQANLCIKHIPEIPEDTFEEYDKNYNQYMGEAYFIRAFSYFYMTRVWGDVPIVSDSNPDEADLKDYARNDKDQVLLKVIDDCKTALKYLGWDYSNVDDKAVRANAGAAWALLAHAYAWAGNYSSAEIAANKVIEDGGYTYVDRNSYSNIYSGQSSESIFEIAQNSSTESAGYSVAHHLLRGKYLFTRKDNTQTIWTLDEDTFRETFFDDENDLRRINGFDNWTIEDNQGFWPNVLKFANISYTSPTSPLASNNIIVFRLAGITLLKAEALAAQNRFSEARMALNEVRNISGLEDSTVSDDDLFEAIIQERGRELFLEGHRFYDLVRLAREKQIYKFGSDNSDKIKPSDFLEGKSYWPIQPTLIETNPLLKQTEYWSALTL
ncbi:RagB/SusD family nutrient uptake outer membrane protein [Thalassobellus citreus]|uniref:RagB/SusD family nutrient uptake outer membrane protein n=1 Tax=Thalassobellus citreus TaxID=3367752 RepID=UPI0037A744A2